MSIEDEQMVSFTGEELTVLNRIFKFVGEEHLRANYFTKADIEAVYSVLGKVRTGLEEWQLDHATDATN
tara:strand:+ start:345 stop:551 length:207 start_codon:yes stop_codon:yes gene_type:complete